MGKNKKLKGVPLIKEPPRHDFTLQLVIRDQFLDLVTTQTIRGYTEADEAAPSASQFAIAITALIRGAADSLIPMEIQAGGINTEQAIAEMVLASIKGHR